MKNIFTYNQGDALLKLKETKDELHKLDGFELAAHFSEVKEEVQTFQDYKYFHIWAAILIKHGKAVKKQTDNFISELIPLNDSFFNKKSKFDEILKKIITHQNSVRNYEIDVYDFINSYSASDINQKANVKRDGGNKV